LHKNPLGKSDFEVWIDRLLEGVRQGHPIGGAAGTLVKGYGYQTLEHHPSLVEGKKLPLD
jgi:hypothetical protein